MHEYMWCTCWSQNKYEHYHKMSLHMPDLAAHGFRKETHIKKTFVLRSHGSILASLWTLKIPIYLSEWTKHMRRRRQAPYGTHSEESRAPMDNNIPMNQQSIWILMWEFLLSNKYHLGNPWILVTSSCTHIWGILNQINFTQESRWFMHKNIFLNLQDIYIKHMRYTLYLTQGTRSSLHIIAPSWLKNLCEYIMYIYEKSPVITRTFRWQIKASIN